MQLEVIQSKIHEIRGYKVMLDFDLADLYQTEPVRLNNQLSEIYPDFLPILCSYLNEIEIDTLVSQSVIPSKSKLGGAAPFAYRTGRCHAFKCIEQRQSYRNKHFHYQGFCYHKAIFLNLQ